MIGDTRINTQSQLWCVYCGVAFMATFFFGWVLVARFLPPLDPAMPAAQVAALFDERSVAIRLGMFICMWSCLFQMPFLAVIVGQIARIEGDNPRVWTYTALMAAAGNILSFTIPLMFWNVAAFRADRAPELVVLMNDMAWLPFTGMAVPFIAMPPCVAIASFIDRAKNPIFPRWYGYYSIATTVVILPAGLVPFFQSGWFAWNNAFGWWVPFADFFGWFTITVWLLRKGILAQAAEAVERAAA